ncbi:hypothetical protein [Serratia sp. Ag2]|uniref:hypothetical protein n=1 Tax=Serratia sp. Ag2 TaxID=1532556 RepID=UPI00050297EE|nr:hypothetical protein [Serratia sp. Ag2]KFK91756.1 hypothetical protein JV45_24490 [Serratia sp. Ag2]
MGSEKWRDRRRSEPALAHPDLEGLDQLGMLLNSSAEHRTMMAKRLSAVRHKSDIGDVLFLFL